MTTDFEHLAHLTRKADLPDALPDALVACAQELLEVRMADRALPYLVRASSAVASAELAALHLASGVDSPSSKLVSARGES